MLAYGETGHNKTVGRHYGIIKRGRLDISLLQKGIGNMPSTGAKVLTVNELSEYLRVHRSTIYRLLKKGQLPGFKIGSDWRFNVEAIDEWRLQQGAAQLEELRAEVGH
jgi:excisionase family DNA binding protein